MSQVDIAKHLSQAHSTKTLQQECHIIELNHYFSYGKLISGNLKEIHQKVFLTSLIKQATSSDP